MKSKKKLAIKVPAAILNAEAALRIAVAKTIEDHRLAGQPIVVWQNGRVVRIPASRIPRQKLAYSARGRRKSTRRRG